MKELTDAELYERYGGVSPDSIARWRTEHPQYFDKQGELIRLLSPKEKEILLSLNDRFTEGKDVTWYNLRTECGQHSQLTHDLWMKTREALFMLRSNGMIELESYNVGTPPNIRGDPDIFTVTIMERGKKWLRENMQPQEAKTEVKQEVTTATSEPEEIERVVEVKSKGPDRRSIRYDIISNAPIEANWAIAKIHIQMLREDAEIEPAQAHNRQIWLMYLLGKRWLDLTPQQQMEIADALKVPFHSKRKGKVKT